MHGIYQILEAVFLQLQRGGEGRRGGIAGTASQRRSRTPTDRLERLVYIGSVNLHHHGGVGQRREAKLAIQAMRVSSRQSKSP